MVSREWYNSTRDILGQERTLKRIIGIGASLYVDGSHLVENEWLVIQQKAEKIL